MAVDTSTPRDDDDDSDWEYEYDQTETDTFYVTLDLTSHIPASYHTVKTDPVNKGSTTPTPQPYQPPGGTNAGPPDVISAVQDVNAKTAGSASKQIQFLDLHTSNPLVSYNNKLFNCSWATSIGTDIILSKDAPSTKNGDPYTASPPNLNVPEHILPVTRPGYSLALSSLRLIAKPLALIPHPEPAATTDPSSTPAPQTPQPPASTLTAFLPQPPPPPLPSTHPANTILHDRPAQHSFLTRLAALRASHGYNVPVPLHPSNVDFSGVELPTPSLNKKSVASVVEKTPGKGAARKAAAAASETPPLGASLPPGTPETPELQTPRLPTEITPTTTPATVVPRRMTASSRGLGSWGGNRGKAGGGRGRGSRRGRGWRERTGLLDNVRAGGGESGTGAGTTAVKGVGVQAEVGESGFGGQGVGAGVQGVLDPMLDYDGPAATAVGAVSMADFGAQTLVDSAATAVQSGAGSGRDVRQANEGAQAHTEGTNENNDTVMRDE